MIKALASKCTYKVQQSASNHCDLYDFVWHTVKLLLNDIYDAFLRRIFNDFKGML